jgi:hypothetical protein
MSLPLPPALLREYERLHAQWRAASEAADAIEGGTEVERLLECRMEAEEAQREAMSLVRGAPI